MQLYAWKLWGTGPQQPSSSSSVLQAATLSSPPLSATAAAEEEKEDEFASPITDQMGDKRRFANIIGIRYQPKVLQNGLMKNFGGVYVWGSNECGQLGLLKANIPSSKVPVNLQALTDCGVQQLECCGDNTIAVLDNGSVVCWGKNDKAQLGFLAPHAVGPVLVTLPGSAAQIVQVSCGSGHAAALSSAGLVYSWGANEYLQLGHRKAAGFASAAPALVDEIKTGGGELIRMKFVACGGEYTAAITLDHNHLWTWGRNDLGQLGHGKIETRSHPRTSHVRIEFEQVCCGVFHTVGYTSDGEVWAWGLNDSGQLGIGHTQSTCAAVRVDYLGGGAGYSGGIVQVAVGLFYTLAVSDAGRVFAWGCGDQGQLGCGAGMKQSLLPHPIDSLHGCMISFVAAGESHACAVTVDGAVYVWGRHEHGRLGVPTPAPQAADGREGLIEWVPRLVEDLPRDKPIVMVGCGDFHTVALGCGVKGEHFSNMGEVLVELQDVIRDLRDLVEYYRRPLLASVETSRMIIPKAKVDAVFGDAEDLLLFSRRLLLIVLKGLSEGKRIGVLLNSGDSTVGGGSDDNEVTAKNNNNNNNVWDGASYFVQFANNATKMAKAYYSCRRSRRFRRFCDERYYLIGRTIDQLLFTPERHVGIFCEILRMSISDYKISRSLEEAAAASNNNNSNNNNNNNNKPARDLLVGGGLDPLVEVSEEDASGVKYRQDPVQLNSKGSHHSGFESNDSNENASPRNNNSNGDNNNMIFFPSPSVVGTAAGVGAGGNLRLSPDSPADEGGGTGLLLINNNNNKNNNNSNNNGRDERINSSMGAEQVLAMFTAFEIDREGGGGGGKKGGVSMSAASSSSVAAAGSATSGSNPGDNNAVTMGAKIENVARRGGFLGWIITVMLLLFIFVTLIRIPSTIINIARLRSTGRGGKSTSIRRVVSSNSRAAAEFWYASANFGLDLLGRETFSELGAVWASAVAVLLAVFPPVMVLVLSQLGAFAADGSIRKWITGVSLAGFFLLMFFATVMLFIKTWKMDHSHRVLSRSSRVRINFSNIIAIISLIIECWQLNAIAFSPGAGVPFPKTLTKVFSLSFLVGDYITPAELPLDLAIVIVIPVIWVFLTEVSPSLRNGSFGQIVVSYWLAPLFLSPLYMPALAHILSSVTCTHSLKRNAFYLDWSLERLPFDAFPMTCTNATGIVRIGNQNFPRYYHSTIFWDEPSSTDKTALSGNFVMSLCSAIGCWEPLQELSLSQSLLALVALYGFSVYFPSATASTHPSYFSDPDLDIRYTPIFLMLVQIAKAVMIFFYIYMARWTVPYLLVGILTNAFLFLFVMRRRPCCIPWVNFWRPLSFAMSIWSCFASLIVALIFGLGNVKQPLEDGGVPAIILLVGWGGLITLWIGGWISIRKRWNGAKLVPGDPSMDLITSGTYEVTGALERQIATKRRWYDIPGLSSPPMSLVAPRVRTSELLGSLMGGSAVTVTPGGNNNSGGIAMKAVNPGEKPPKLPPMRIRRMDAASGKLEGSNPDPHWEDAEILDLSYQELGYQINIDELMQTLRETVNVKQLLLVSNHLSSLRNVWLPFLKSIDLSNNKIASFGDLPKAPSLQIINLSQNRILPTAAAVKHMRRYKKLQRLTLRGNPLAFSPEYHKLVRQYCPSTLTILDEKPFGSSNSGAGVGIIAAGASTDNQPLTEDTEISAAGFNIHVDSSAAQSLQY